MKYPKLFGHAVVALALMAIWASAASATTLEVGGVPKNETVEVNLSLASGSSLTLKATSGVLQNTCTTSTAAGKVVSFPAAVLTAKLSTLSFGSCTRTVTVHEPGALEVTWIPGTTNGTVFSEEAQVTSGSPAGTLNCTTGATTHIGTITGVGSGNAMLHINALINCGIVSSAKWEGTYSVTSPGGFGVTDALTTTLEVGGTANAEKTEITGSLQSGKSLILKDTSGFLQNTCTASHLNASTSSPYTGASVTAPISTLTFSGCNRVVTVHAPGKLEIVRIGSTTDGTVYSQEAQVTSGSPVGTLKCNTPEKTKLGTLTGVSSGNATLHISSVINCGIVPSIEWEGTYTVTSPAGLGVTDTPTTGLEVGGSAKVEQLEITGSLSGGGSLLLKDTSGFSQNTCSASHFNASTNSPYTGTSVTAPISTLTFGGCTRPVTVHAPGKLEVVRVGSTTNGTVYSEEAQVTSGSPIGTLNCTTGPTTKLGTLTGVASGNATLHIKAMINCGIIASAEWEGTYTVTSPAGLGVTS